MCILEDEYREIGNLFTFMGKLAILHDQVTITVGALAALDLISQTSKIDSSRTRGFRVMRYEYGIVYRGKTASEGPLLVGDAFNPSATADMEECLEADPQDDFSSDGSVAQNIANRPVQELGLIAYNETAGKLFDGGFRVRKPTWSCPEGGTLQFWVYNLGGSQLTTGTVVTIVIKAYGVWLND